jgi:hypothetical protein
MADSESFLVQVVLVVVDQAFQSREGCSLVQMADSGRFLVQVVVDLAFPIPGRSLVLVVVDRPFRSQGSSLVQTAVDQSRGRFLDRVVVVLPFQIPENCCFVQMCSADLESLLVRIVIVLSCQS